MEEGKKRGRPKGSKNKPKRGRPKGSGKKTPKAKVKKAPKQKTSTLVVETDDLLARHLDDNKLTEIGYNVSTDKIINQEPIDLSFYYRGSKNVPVAGAQYEFTVDMIEELRKCKTDIVYFAENFFYIVNLDNGKQKIKLYEAQKNMLKNMVDNRFSVNLASRQSGKALSLDTLIATTTGYKTLGELTTKDIIFGSDGSQINITHIHPIEYNRPCYRITFDNGEVITADEEHEWFTHSRQERRNKKPGSVKTTKQIFATLKASGTNEPNHRIPISLVGIQSTERNLPIDPYVLGLWLGDGAKEAGWITVGDRDIEFVLENLNSNKQFNEITTRRYDYTRATYVTISTKQNKQTKSLHTLIKKHGLYKNKHIPEEYFLSSRSQKIELLKGLIDSDGYVEKNGVVTFYSSDLNLANQVNRLINELGYKTTITHKQAKLNKINKKISYGVNFKPRELVATLPFKADRIKVELNAAHNSKKRAQFHYIIDVEPCESVPVRCITVDSKDSLFLVGKNLIPTHNSTLLTIFVLWMACFNDDHRAAIVANKESTAINIFKRVRMAYEQLPNYIKPGVKDYGKTGMTLGNDSSILVSTTTATSIRGDSLSTLAIDEVAFIESHILEEFWSSVIPAVSSGKKSKVLLVSTPNGVGNKFYEIFSGAENGTLPAWRSSRIDWWDRPERDEKWKQDQIQLLGSEEKFEQEFGNTFLDDASSAVGASVLERFKQEKKEPIWSSEDGEYTVYEYPNKNCLYVIGVDVGEGIGRAASVAQILDVTDLQNIKQVGVYASSKIEPYHFANKLSTLGQSWGLPPILIERNNCGAQVIDALYHNHNYEKIVSYNKISEQDKYNRTRNMGVLSHTNIRFDGIQNMRYWINHLQTVHINDPHTISEFETFVRFPNGTFRKRSDSFFDDRVMALVWALYILESELCQQYFEIVEYDMQHKPQQIKNNGFWEIIDQFYELKDLSKQATIIPKPYNPDDEKIFPTLDVTKKEIEEIDNYQYDLEELLQQGYEFF